MLHKLSNDLVPGYTYTMPSKDDILDFINTFTRTFLKADYYKNPDGKPVNPASEEVYSFIMKEYFYLDYDNANTRINLDNYKGKYVSPIFDILDALLYYCKNTNNVTDGTYKANASLLFMIMFTNFTLKQGGAIVTSLEHLLLNS